MKQRGEHAHSIIWTKLNMFTAWIYKVIRQSLTGRILCGYSFVERRMTELFERFFSRAKNVNGSYLPASVQNFFAGSLEKSHIIRFIQMLQTRIRRASVYSFGTFLLYSLVGTGFLGIVIAYLTRGTFLPDINYLILDAILLITGLLCIIPKRYTESFTLGAAIQKSFLRFIINGLGVQTDEGVSRDGAASQEMMLSFVMSLIVTGLCLWVGPLYMLLIFIGFVMIVNVFQCPESGLILVTFLTPLLFFTPIPTILLVAMLLLTAVSFLVKVLSGRRRMRFRLIDALVLLWGIIQLLAGATGYRGTDSFVNGLLCCVLLLGYFLTVNLMRDKSWLSRMYYALLVSTFLMSALSLIISLIPRQFIDLFDSVSLDNVILNVRAVLDSPHIISMMLILLLPLALLFLFRYRKRILSHAFVALMEAMLIYGLINSWTRSAWLGAIISILFMVLLIDNRTLSVMILAAPGVVLAFMLLLNFGDGLFNFPVAKRFMSIVNFSDESVRYRVEVWQSTMTMIRDNFLSGIGIGREAFRAVYPSYAAVGTEGAEHAYMFYLQILAEAGIGGLFIFCLCMVALLQKSFEFITIETDKFTRKNVVGGLCGIIAFLIAGIFDYGWYNHQLYFVFWLVFGFICANVRAGNDAREEAKGQVFRSGEIEEVVIHF